MPQLRLARKLMIALAVVAALSSPAGAAEVKPRPVRQADRHEGRGFLDSELNRLLAEAGAGGTTTGVGGGAARVKVSFVFTDERSAEAADGALPLLGGEVTARYGRLLDAWVPVSALGDLGTLPGLMIAHRPFPPFPARVDASAQAAAGLVQSEGVVASGANDWLIAGVDGAGVTVGIIDSFAEYAVAVDAGELPSPAAVIGTIDASSTHGTACAEVVHDMAPGAGLVLASATSTTEAAAAIAALAGTGAQVISSSVEFVAPDGAPGREPGDGSSALCQAISQARSASGVLFVQSAGNHALSHWDGAFADTDRDLYHEFAPGVQVDKVALGATSVAAFLRWDDWPASSQDFDLELVVQNGAAWEVVTKSQNEQSGTQPPWEYVEYVLDPLKQYGFRIKKYGATRNVFLDLTEMRGARLDPAVPARSLADVAACPDALSVAALDVQQPDFPLDPASSQGPTYGPGGIASGGHDQPRLGAYSGVDTLTYGLNGFGGTSAAAPHVAGAAALVLQRQPTFTADQVQSFLEARAIDVASTPPGYDFQTGNGRLSLGDPGPCAYALTPPGADAPLEGVSGSFDVATDVGCPWQAVSDAPWLTVTGGASGSGNGTVAYAVEANTGAERSAKITVGTATFTVTQPSAPCIFQLSAPSASVPAAGGDASVDVTANFASCDWTAESGAAWITVTAGASGTGNGTVTITAAANEGDARTGTVTIAGLTFTVEQAAAVCEFALSAPGTSFPAAGGDGSVEVTANLASCGWTATPSAAWITITGGTPGTGNGTVTFSVAANEGEARTGTVTIAGLEFTVEQAAAPCAFSLSAPGVAAGAAGGEGTVGVTANLASCAWTAVSDAPWITVTGGASGTGSGTVTYLVAANPGDARTGTVTIAGRTFTVEQAAAPCAYELSVPGAAIPAAGGEGSVGVVANRSACSWTAVANAPWITVTGGASGSGNGIVTFTVAANPGAARAGSITIAGIDFAVTQEAVPCAFSLASLSSGFTASGGAGSVALTANIATCSWTAAANVAWLAITGATSGTGSGTVAFSVGANSGAARTGTLTIAGLTFSVLQGAAGCSYSLYSWSSSYTSDGGSGQTRVWTSPTTCTWNAISNAPSWITITAGQSGTGAEIVSFDVAPNPGVARQGTLTIAGRTYIVNQAGPPCTYTLSADGADFDAAGGSGSVGMTTSGSTCQWTAMSSAPDWLTVTAGAPGTGPGTVSFAVAPNTGPARTATLLIGYQVFTVRQASPPCSVSINPHSASIGGHGGTGTVSVTANFSTCGWTAVSSAPSWLTVTSGASGTGTGSVGYAVAENPAMAQRSATLSIGGETFTLTQERNGVQVRRHLDDTP